MKWRMKSTPLRWRMKWPEVSRWGRVVSDWREAMKAPLLKGFRSHGCRDAVCAKIQSRF